MTKFKDLKLKNEYFTVNYKKMNKKKVQISRPFEQKKRVSKKLNQDYFLTI